MSKFRHSFEKQLASVILHVHMCPTYIQHMHCFMWYVCKINTYTYNNGYAQHTSMCISHMHSAYLICTCIYLHVCACICMYWVFYELYPVHMSMYVLTRQCSYSMIQSDMHITRSAYLHVFECILSLHTYRYALILMCISVCI